MENSFCPLIDCDISADDCIENIDIIDGMFGNESNIPDQFKVKPNYKEICKKCKHHESTWGEANND